MARWSWHNGHAMKGMTACSMAKQSETVGQSWYDSDIHGTTVMPRASFMAQHQCYESKPTSLKPRQPCHNSQSLATHCLVSSSYEVCGLASSALSCLCSSSSSIFRFRRLTPKLHHSIRYPLRALSSPTRQRGQRACSKTTCWWRSLKKWWRVIHSTHNLFGGPHLSDAIEFDHLVRTRCILWACLSEYVHTDKSCTNIHTAKPRRNAPAGRYRTTSTYGRAPPDAHLSPACHVAAANP